ncbi:MAG: hypothetical protein ABIJ34_03530 [archaeon]
MNKVVLLCMSVAISVIIFFVLYLIPYFSKKKIRQGKFDIQQFLNLFVSPILIIPFLYFLRQIIIQTQYKMIIYTPKYINELMFLLLLYFMIMGNSIHSVSVVLSKHMKNMKKEKVWEINEFFHNAFSHFLLTASAVFILLSFAILEINHPALVPISNLEIAILIVCGVVFGIILGIASIEGSVPHLMLPVIYILSLMIPFIFIKHNLDFIYFPFTTFVETAFAAGGITIFIYRKLKNGYPEIVPQHFFD